MIRYAFLFLFLFCNILFATANTDQEHLALKKIYQDVLKYRNTDVQLFYEGIQKLLNQSKKAKNKYYESMGLRELGFYYIIKAEPDSSLVSLNQCMVLIEELDDDTLKIKCNEFMGLAYIDMFNYYDAIQTYRKQIQLAHKINATNSIKESLHMLGEIYKTCHDYEKAMDFFKQSKTVNNIDIEQEGWWFLNVGELHFLKGDYKEALLHYDSALTIWSEINMIRGMGFTYNSLGDLYLALDSSDCILNYKKAIEHNTKLDNKSEILLGVMGIGNFYAKQKGSHDLAVKEFAQAISYGIKNNLVIPLIPALDFFIKKPNYQGLSPVPLDILWKTRLQASEAAFKQTNKKELKSAETLDKAKEAEHNKEISQQNIFFFKKLIRLLNVMGLLTFFFILYAVIINNKLKRSQRKVREQYQIISEQSRKKDLYLKNIDELNIKLNQSLQTLSVQKNTLHHKNEELESINNRSIILINRLKKFASILSHDLKEPIRSVYSFGGILKKRAGVKLNEPESEFLEFMIDGSKRMNNMVNVLYKYSNNTLAILDTFSPINLNTIVADVQKDLHKIITDKNVQFIVGELPFIEGQETMFHQLFQNLISNSIKYAKKGRLPLIKINAIQNKNEIIVFVEDNGIGIKEEENTNELFTLFKRSNDQNNQKGAGIGLATCKEIIEIHKGRIWMESVYQQGTKVSFSLPADLVSA